MKHSIHLVLQAGMHHDVPEYLKNRVQPTNIICLLVIFILAIPFVIISLIFFPGMAVFPAGGGITALAVLLINYMGGIYYSRLVLPVLLLTLSSLFNAYFSTSISDSIVGVYMVELSFTLIPFVIFDFSEKKFLWLSTAFSFFILLIFPMSWQYFDMGYTGIELREGPLAILTVMLSIVFQLLCITGLAIINKQSENRSSILFQEMSMKKTEVEQARRELENNISALEKSREEERERQWTAEGITRIAALLRSNRDEKLLYDDITAMVVKYIKANQAGFYIVENKETASDTCIQLAARYAYDRKKYMEQSFEPGQGLIGQVYLEKEYIYMTHVPENYVYISSGLGEATARFLLVIPMKINGTVEGILEIASFYAFKPYQIDFLNKACENIASFIQSNRVNIQTRHLLQQSQLQSEALRAQEEEMRQNMEELQATQEEMYRKENEHLHQIEDLHVLLKAAEEFKLQESDLQAKLNMLELKLQELSLKEQQYLNQINKLNASLTHQTGENAAIE